MLGGEEKIGEFYGIMSKGVWVTIAASGEGAGGVVIGPSVVTREAEGM
jgi:hypothetical protein